MTVIVSEEVYDKTIQIYIKQFFVKHWFYLVFFGIQLALFVAVFVNIVVAFC